MSNKPDIRVAVAGVGNCAASLIAGVGNHQEHSEIVGLRRPVFGGYDPSAIIFTAAFDVDARKVGQSLFDAAQMDHVEIPDYCFNARWGNVPSWPIVLKAPPLDGIGSTSEVQVSGVDECDVVGELKEAQVDVLVNYVPVGSTHAARFYAQCALEAGCAFVNAMPVPIAATEEWAEKFSTAGLPLIGDDIKSQLGATVLHRHLAALFAGRGIRLDSTIQLNVGGNADFANLMDRTRIGDKRASKTGAVTSAADVGHVFIEPSAYIPHLGDTKWAYINLTGQGWDGAPIKVEIKLEVEDSPNSAGVVVDAVRLAKVALERGDKGALSASAALMKSPPVQLTEAEGNRLLAEYAEAQGA